LSVVR